MWQYVALMKRIFLIDSPGVVYDAGDSEADTVLKGVVRAERLETPQDFIESILARVKPAYITKQYGVEEWEDTVDFLTRVAKKSGKLLKGGEPDFFNVSVTIINDFQRVSSRELRLLLCFNHRYFCVTGETSVFCRPAPPERRRGGRGVRRGGGGD